jgi:hypothetical protein
MRAEPGECDNAASRPGPEPTMDLQRVFRMSFASIYPLYVQKVEKKGRKAAEVDEVICWLTGYNPRALADQIKRKTDLQTFFREAPKLHPNAKKITGVICGVRIEEIEDPLMKKIRYMDKLVDELAKGRPMEKILRA